MPNESSATHPEQPEMTRFTVEQQWRLEALNFATALTINELQAQRHLPEKDGVDHGSRYTYVLQAANAYYDFLAKGGEQGQATGLTHGEKEETA